MGKWVTEYAVLADARIAYRQYGAGPTLLLLHGEKRNPGMKPTPSAKMPMT